MASIFDRSVLAATMIALVLFTASPIVRGQQSTGFNHGVWPFRPPQRTKRPDVTAEHRLDNAVDSFVVAKLQESGIRGNDRAGNLTLLRRLSFDLTGLPPTRQQRHEFLADRSPDAYQRLVDRLLASPAHGERWAQHWLDVVRYAETEGFKADKLRASAFRYRDYVIRSLNADRPYDQFVRQQLAGDQLDPDNPDAMIATGLNRLYPDEDNAANLFQRRQEILNDVTETTGLAFMGLTMGCAQCHDHKFDNISQADFYRLQAFFAPMTERDDVYAASSQAITEYEQQLAAWNAATQDIRSEIDELFAEERAKTNAFNLTKFRPAIQQAYLKPAAERTPVEEQIARMVDKQLKWRFDPEKAVKKLPKVAKERYQELERRLEQFDHLKPRPLPKAMAVGDVGPVAPPTYLLDGGNWKKPLSEIEPGFPEFLGGAVTPVSLKTKTQSTWRRAELASWLTRKDHPLTARVIVNRLWHHHFGRGIVPTPNDFGNMGDYPTHPELLDWLAVELIESGWSLKHMHRVMVSSATYCQSASVAEENPVHAKALDVDPANELLWHARRRRLGGESIRDALLSVCGQLNRQMFGSSSRPPLPEGISPRYAWKPDADESKHVRRSIYVLAKRNMRYPLFDVFDLPDMHNSCACRATTTNAPQALLMFNSRTTQQLAEYWASRLIAQSGHEVTAMITRAYESAFGRMPSGDEIAAANNFLVAHRDVSRPENMPSEIPLVNPAGQPMKVPVTAITDFCHALLNSNEFIYID